MCALQSNHEKPTEILCNNTCRLHLWSTIIILDIILPCSNHAGMQFLIIHSQRNRFFALQLLNNTQHQIFIYSIHAIHFPLPSHCRVPPNSKPCCLLSAHIGRRNCSIHAIHIYCDIALLPHFHTLLFFSCTIPWFCTYQFYNPSHWKSWIENS